MIAWWAGEAPQAAPVWQTWLPAIIAAVITAAGAAGGTVWVKRMNRRLDDATTNKTVAESRKAEAETTSIEVSTARSLITEIKDLMAQQKVEFAEQKAEFAARDAERSEQIKALTGQVSDNREQLRAVQNAISAHEMWDRDAVAALRQNIPGFPDPPPVNVDWP